MLRSALTRMAHGWEVMARRLEAFERSVRLPVPQLVTELRDLLGAMRWTLGLSLVAFIGGGLVGLLVALLRVAPVAPLRWLAAGYIQLLQATPLLMLLFLVFFGLALVGLSQDAFVSGPLAGCTCCTRPSHWNGSQKPHHSGCT